MKMRAVSRDEALRAAAAVYVEAKIRIETERALAAAAPQERAA
ncbi:hypothetical protein J2X03_003823 [Microbacterium trichothecenolyticum]|nr:hypothetical protein [Microbacterium trichothecenolyticum]MDR7113921.1 hypothetical protein [Microbacterium trichothecenolyticum]